MIKRSIILLDALNIFSRHYIANMAMNASGAHVGGIIGFLSNLRTLADMVVPTDIFICWEGANGASRKRSLYPEYKGNRKPPKLNRFYGTDIPDSKENKNWQIASLADICKSLPVCQIYISDIEGDDIIGYISKYKFMEAQKIIVSNDKDFYQLLNDKIKIYSPNTKLFIRKEEVVKEFGVSANNFCLAKCINGDKSDNINGLRGVGFKSISKSFPFLLNEEIKNINDIIEFSKESVEQKSTKKIYKNVLENESIIKRNWRLMHLDTNNLSANHIKKIDQIVDDFKPKMDKMEFIKKLISRGITQFSAESFCLALGSVVKL